MSESSIPRRAARSATAPAREFFNGHFEMLKEEIRRVGEASGQPPADLAPVLERIDEMSELLAEQSAHQARSAARQTEEVTALSDRVAELERLLHRLIDVVTPVDAE